MNGKRPKTSIGIEKGFYWSNNTGTTNTTVDEKQFTAMGLENGPVKENRYGKKMTHFNSQTGKINLQKHP